MLKPTKHYKLTLTLAPEDFGHAFGVLRQMPWYDETSIELQQVFEDDDTPHETTPPSRVIRDEGAVVELRPMQEDKPFNANHLTGANGEADRQVTRDAAKAIFEACWPELSAKLDRWHHREMFFTAARQLRVPPNRVKRALAWLLDYDWLCYTKSKGYYSVGEKSPLFLAHLEAATAPALSSPRTAE